MFHVKHLESSEVVVSAEERAEVIRCAGSLGIVVTDAHAGLLLAHLDAVLESNKRLSLTAITDRERAIRLHVVDSLAVVTSVAACEGRMADIGSGAGFPGIPVAIASQRPVDLIESVKKKATFLGSCVDALGGLSGSGVIPLRAEEAAVTHRGQYGCVMARALTSLAALVELASPLLRVGGSLVAMKGAPTAVELDHGGSAAAVVGMQESSRSGYTLPGSDERRTIVCYTKVTEPTIGLPRRIGLAQKRPLG